jgi:hypothetical protein
MQANPFLIRASCGLRGPLAFASVSDSLTASAAVLLVLYPVTSDPDPK